MSAEPVTNATTRAAVEDFLHAEAGLLDDGDYRAWLALFTPDAHYWIPAGADDTDPTRTVSIVYDDLRLLSERVWRFTSGLAYAQEPASRTSHMVGNIRVCYVEQNPLGAVIDVQAAFTVMEFRRDTLHTHAGRYRYKLLPTGGTFSILLKKIQLINNDGKLGNLSLLL
jgi:benzoate/toluate 1,2-dioxygenase beta subunit